MPAVALLVAGGDAAPGQVLELSVQARLVLLHNQDVVGFLRGDQELGVLALGMQGVRSDDAPGQVQWLQQRGELGDLVGLVIHADLGEHRTGSLIGDRQQVHGPPILAGVPGAPHRLAVHRQRPPRSPAVLWPRVYRSQPRRQPRSHCSIERVGVDGLQDPPDRGFIRRREPAGQWIPAHPERAQDLRRRVRGPLADGGVRPGPGEHRRHGRQ